MEEARLEEEKARLKAEKVSKCSPFIGYVINQKV